MHAPSKDMDDYIVHDRGITCLKCMKDIPVPTDTLAVIVRLAYLHEFQAHRGG